MATGEKKFWEDLRNAQANALENIDNAKQSLEVVERKQKICKRFVKKLIQAMVKYYFNASIARPNEFPLQEEKCKELLSASFQQWVLDTFNPEIQREVITAFKKHNSSTNVSKH